MKNHRDNGYPNEIEAKMLDLAFKRFRELSFELYTKEDSDEKKFTDIKGLFEIFAEIKKYEPIKYFLEKLIKAEDEEIFIIYTYFVKLRHLLSHFPIYKNWNEFCFNKEMVLWNEEDSQIDKFFMKNEGIEKFKTKLWEDEEMNDGQYVSIAFPSSYSRNEVIYLKDLIDQDDGIKLVVAMIGKIFNFCYTKEDGESN